VDDGGALKRSPPTPDGDAEREDGGRSGSRREALELPRCFVDEGVPLHEILGRVAADHLLGEDGETDALVGRPARERDAAIDVGADRADGGVDVDDAELDEPHGVAVYRGRATDASVAPRWEAAAAILAFNPNSPSGGANVSAQSAAPIIIDQ
jgi:hypothetical protein